MYSYNNKVAAAVEGILTWSEMTSKILNEKKSVAIHNGSTSNRLLLALTVAVLVALRAFYVCIY